MTAQVQEVSLPQGTFHPEFSELVVKSDEQPKAVTAFVV